MTGEARRIAYRPELDGLRALAVIAVLLFHHYEQLRGGFLGVDVFFVLSGFLITSLLVAEHDRTGRIDLPDFWRRRARRLLPAVFLLMVIVAALATWVVRAEFGTLLRRDALAALFYVENWYRISAHPPTQPLGHVWSLSIEEQWYLLSPVLLLGLLRWTRGRTAPTAAVAAGAALASAVAMFVIYGDGSGQNRAYLGTDTRVQGLLVGAVLALLVGRREQRFGRRASIAVEVAGWAGVVFVGTLMVRAGIRDEFFYRGGFLLVAIAVAAVITAAIHSDVGALRRVLASKPLVAIGLVSYGLYLFHVPVNTWLSPSRTDLDRELLLPLRLGATLAVALASYFLVERPVRAGTLRNRRPLVLTAVAAAVSIGLVMLATRHTPLPPEQARLAYAMSAAAQRAPDDATRIAVVGDSVAFSLAIAGKTYSTPEVQGVAWGRLGCGIGGGAPIVEGVPLPAAGCARWPQMFHVVTDWFEPDVTVLLTGTAEAFDRAVDGEVLTIGSDELDRHLRGQLDRAKAVLTRGDTRLVVALPAACAGSGAADTADIEHIRALWTEWAADAEIEVVDFAALLCPDGEPVRTKDGVPLLENSSFTPAGARAAWEWIAAEAGA